MRLRLSLLLFFGWAGWFGGNRAAAQTKPAAGDPAALQADHDFLEAVASGDKAALADLLDTDFTWTTAEGKTYAQSQILTRLPQPLLTDGKAIKVTSFSYGQVDIVESQGEAGNVLRVWVKRPEGWRQLLYQEVRPLEAGPDPAATSGGACENPCKSLPYNAKSQTEQDILTGYMALQTAIALHDATSWDALVADEFSGASSDTSRPLNKADALTDFQKKLAAFAPVPMVSLRMFDFPEASLLISRHQLQGNAKRVARLWVKRGGKWIEALEYQTTSQ